MTRILIVDDHEENLYLLKSLFKAHGHEVIQASNGEEAYKIIEQGSIELIVSDILMPVMDGFKLCQKVKANSALASIPLIFYTATYTGAQDEEFALKIGADAFIVKPCEPDVLISEVNKVLSNASAKHANGTEIDEHDALRLYSERLVRKLEQKMMEAEAEIKARLEIEQELISSHERLISSQRIARMGDFTWDTQTNEVTWSEALYELLKYDKSTKITYELVDNKLHHPEDRDSINAWLQSSINSGSDKLLPHKYRLIDSEGYVLNVRTLGIIKRQEGHPPVVFATLQDITEVEKSVREKEELQSQLYQAQKMESIGRLAGGVAHDFNNMLSVILGYSELIIGQMNDTSPFYPFVEEIKKAALRSSDLTRQLLAFARKQTIEPKIIDLNHKVQDSVMMLQRLIGERIELNKHLEGALWPVKLDPGQIDQILANLCVNARDAIEGSGSILIATKNLVVKTEDVKMVDQIPPGNYVLLSVSDSGTGMDKETMSKIFEPFFTTKDPGRGTGLGLPTVYGIAKQNGGYINLESEIGKGTTFSIYFPRCAEELTKDLDDHTSSEKPHESSARTILVAEDEKALLQMVETMLKHHGYKVLPASSAAEAIELCKKHKDEIIMLLADLVMPGMSGYDLAKKITDLAPEAKCLFMSGFAVEHFASGSLIEEKCWFIAKPFSMKQLATKIHEVLSITMP